MLTLDPVPGPDDRQVRFLNNCLYDWISEPPGKPKRATPEVMRIWTNRMTEWMDGPSPNRVVDQLPLFSEPE